MAPRRSSGSSAEARAAATLHHPNLCPVYDVGEVGGLNFLTMPYLEGEPLSDLIERERTFSGPRAAAEVRKLALALQHAHDRGVIHRDLKPANIMVDPRGDLIIMDFGLARRTLVGDPTLTKDGSTLGTAAYMAPEQAAGDSAAVAPTCDVYSLGVILHELLTGVRPFEGIWSVVIGLKTIQDPDPPSKHRPGLDPTLDAICLKAIARRPKDRYATMAEFAEALDCYLSGRPVPNPSGLAPEPESEDEGEAARLFEGIVNVGPISLRAEKPAGPSTRPRRASRSGQGRGPSMLLAVAVATIPCVVLGLLHFGGNWWPSRVDRPASTPSARVNDRKAADGEPGGMTSDPEVDPAEEFDRALFGEVKPGRSEGTEEIRGVEVRVGDPQFTLVWDSDADLDLHVIEPGGKEIFRDDRKGKRGGELDVDSTNGTGPENVYWLKPGLGGKKGPGPGPPGDYVWYVHQNGGAAQGVKTKWIVRVKSQGQNNLFMGQFDAPGQRSGRNTVSIVTSPK